VKLPGFLVSNRSNSLPAFSTKTVSLRAASQWAFSAPGQFVAEDGKKHRPEKHLIIRVGLDSHPDKKMSDK